MIHDPTMQENFRKITVDFTGTYMYFNGDFYCSLIMKIKATYLTTVKSIVNLQKISYSE